MKRLFTAYAVALVLTLAAGAGAKADPLPTSGVTWSADWGASTPAVYADGNPGAGVTFTNQGSTDATATNAHPSTNLVATNLRTFSVAPPTTPDSISGSSGNYSLQVTLSSAQATPTTTDPNHMTTYSATLTFTGNLSGTFSGGNPDPVTGVLSGGSADISNTFGANSTQTVTLGSYAFTVSLFDNQGQPLYTPPGPPDQSIPGSIGARITVSAITPTSVPEPSTMVLSALGLSFLGSAVWRKRKTRARA